ncbi:hypothetical protein SAMN05444172_3087 [Burkholderia sp. GAS332]|nr:hypothetical protein SAMN05444172_3087 [Burkholderia sp. GAS332]
MQFVDDTPDMLRLAEMTQPGPINPSAQAR